MPIRFPASGDTVWQTPRFYQEAGTGNLYRVERLIEAPAIILRGPAGHQIVIEAGDPRAGDFLALISENEIEPRSAEIVPLIGKVT